MDTGATLLISSLFNVNRTKGFSGVNHTDDPDFIETHKSASMSPKNPHVHKDAQIFIAVLARGQTSMTFGYSCDSKKYFTPAALVIPRTQTTAICEPFLAENLQQSELYSFGFGSQIRRGSLSVGFSNSY
jgi:hypothetical protein